MRVITWPDDGHRVDVLAWSSEHPGRRLLAWKADFDGSTPQDVVLAANAIATGHPSVAR